MLDTKKAVTFFRPVGVPESFHILGHYCQPSGKPLHGFVLVAKICSPQNADTIPPLKNPLDFKLVWSHNAASMEIPGVYFWLPEPPEGYKALVLLIHILS